MRIPYFCDLEKQMMEQEPGGRFSGTFMHPNPHYYKYYWWVFWRGSPCDGHEFLTDRYRMPMKQAFDLIKKLKSERESYWLYNTRLPRRDLVNNPFDPDSDKWRDREWAKPFDEDTDEIFDGFK